jgi:GNAT superfamily N-acetyltransferase
VAIDRRGPEDAEQLFALYRDVFGEALVESSRHRWRWQYLENPHTGPEGPAIWVARDASGPLGQYASMPVRLWWGDREVRSSWGMDVFLRPEARGRGIGAKLFTAWSDAVDVALGLGLTPSSYGLFKKLRYRDVGPVPFYLRVLDPGAVARRRLGGLLGRLAAPLLQAALAVRHPERRAAGSAAIEVRPATGFGPEYDTLWERARSSYAMSVRRDAAYLEWKYRLCPNRRYDVREARRDGELVGYCVTREEDHRGLRLGWLLDVFSHAGDAPVRDALIGSALEGFRAAGVARAQAFSMHAGLGADLERRGFRRGRSPMQFCVRARVAGEAVFEQLGGWHVMFGDSDMDR